MNLRFPAVNAGQVTRVLRKCGFEFVRQSGSSHAIWRRASDGRRVTVPYHGSKVIKRKTLSQILQDAGLSIEEFNSYLGRK